MKHKIKLDEIINIVFERTIASEITSTDSKWLKLTLKNGILKYAVTSYLVDSPATPNTTKHDKLLDAVEHYNNI